MSAKIKIAYLLIAASFLGAGKKASNQPWAYIYSQKKGLEALFAAVWATYPTESRKGQPYDSLLHLLERSPTGLNPKEREFLFAYTSSTAGMAFMLKDEKERLKAVREQEKFDKALVFHALESTEPVYRRLALNLLDHRLTRDSLDEADVKSLRDKSKEIPWHDKFKLLARFGLTEREKAEILALKTSTPLMKAAAGDSAALNGIVSGFEDAADLVSKSDRIGDLLLIGNEDCAKAAFRDLFYPIKRSDSPVSFQPLHLRQRILLVLRKAYPQEALFADPLIGKPYYRADSLAIARYLRNVAAWGRVTLNAAPRDSLQEAFIAYPVPPGRP